MRRCWPWLLLILLTLPVPARAAESVPLLIHVGGSTYHFEAEIADDPAERSRGLMYREDLAANAGMLFLYPDERPRTFWMKNTPLSLDIIFLSEGGEVVHIASAAVPFDETPISSGVPAQAVLEILGGLAAQLGIKPGDRVVWPPRDTAPLP